MPSGKKSRQQRRAAVKAPPPVQSKGGPRRPRQASPRALAIGAVAGVLVVIAVVLGIVLSRGGGSSGIPKGTPTVGSVAEGLPGSAEAAALFKGVPETGLYLGSDSAPVQMVMYIDLQCPVCQNFELTAMPTLVKKYVRPGKVRIEVRPWAFIGPDSFRGQRAMLAAAMQNKAYTFAEVLYVNQATENTGWLTDQMIAQIAASVPGLDVKQLFAQRDSAEVKKQAAAVATQASIQHVQGTPTIFVGKSGAKPKNVAVPGAAPTLQDVESAIQAALGS